MSFDKFFECVMGPVRPYAYQSRLAREDWPDLLDVPTGMGKTAAATVAWLYKRGWRDGGRSGQIGSDTPRRLVWCLPMRVLVEQTEINIRQWLANLGVLGEAGEGKVSVHLLMGGADDVKSWAEYPEEDMILIGTQDMLLSRALMRGYGMSRYQWPIHFSLLHNDCLWVFDEVQLMGAGLATSAQLEAFRRSFSLAKDSRSLWVSATLNRDWLGTVDLAPHLDSLVTQTISAEDRDQAGERLMATKSLIRAGVSLTGDATNESGRKAYAQALCDAVLDAHRSDAQTLVIVNRVDRAQAVFRLLREQRPGQNDLLIHARFRAAERQAQTRRLRSESATDRIIVATQAIEAGVDISSKVLVTELAPWTSMVQRFGRLNRYGEHNAEGARALWINIEDDADTLPYRSEELADPRTRLIALDSVSPGDLPAPDNARPLSAVLRRKDLLDLFNTDPDLSGFDVDISDYIRDSGVPGVQVFWREFKDGPNEPEPQGKPVRDELCPVSIGQAKAFSKRKGVELWHWDTLGDAWLKLDRDPHPGMTLLAKSSDGGYDGQIGFDAGIKKPPVPVNAPYKPRPQNAYGEDWRSLQPKPVGLPDHLGHVAERVRRLCTAVGEASRAPTLIRAGRWHDLGKAHAVFDATMHACDKAPDGFLAKSPCRGRHSRKYFRHELASMLAWLAQHDGEPDADLIAYLIVAHHGKVRMSLRAMPGEEGGEGVKRFARGVWEGDLLPALDFNGEHSNEITLRLALMEIGEGEQGPSWTERTLTLLDRYGPFQLAWLETLVRLADWRASRDEQLVRTIDNTDNVPHELDNSYPPMAQPDAGTAASDTPRALAAQGGQKHGLRGRASGSENAGARTRPPHSATRYLTTTLGVLSYAELAPHLAKRVEALQNAIDDGELDSHDITEDLFLELHRRVCADLTPGFAGRWRTVEVLVGTHEPPPPSQIAQHMRAYSSDLAARLASLPLTPDDLWLEALAFAEGRLLSIHPFADFNGRVSRVFVDLLTRRLNLPDVDPTPDRGASTARYLDALRAADQLDWQPLMGIWRERFEKGVAT